MSIALRLKVMSFLQYFIWGSWLVTLGSYMINTLHFTGANVGMVYSSKGIAAIIMPGIMGIIADKWLRAERAYMLCHLVCAGVLFYAASVTDPDMMFWVMLVNAMAFMPTIALSNSVSYSCLAQAGLDPVTAFPPIRVFGTVGFIVAMWAVSLLHLELSSLQLYIASGASLLLSAYALTLPKIPVAEKKATTSLASKLGLDAFVLFKNPRMPIFYAIHREVIHCHTAQNRANPCADAIYHRHKKALGAGTNAGINFLFDKDRTRNIEEIECTTVNNHRQQQQNKPGW